MKNQANKCATCGETIVSDFSGSLTAWMFRQAQCRCERKLAAGPAAPQSQSVSAQAKVVSAEADRIPAANIGQVVADKYQILEVLGSGGMGTVYKVMDRSSQAIFALKCISSNSGNYDAIQKRLQQEAVAIKALHHPNIVSMHEDGRTADGAHFIVMDMVAGVDLASVLATEGRLKPDRALGIFIQIAEALKHAHENGVVHRDLKPSNILLVQDLLEDDRVRIIDFGIAKVLPRGAIDMTKLSLTQTGDLIGSPLYMSPEQCRGDQLDGRSDIYSCGCTMYEVLAGNPPFVGDNPVRVILKHVADMPPDIPKDLAVTPDLVEVILKCLEKEPIDRYQSASELLADLQKVQQGEAVVRSRPTKSKQPNNNNINNINKWIAAAIVTLTVMVATGAVVSSTFKKTPEASPASVEPAPPNVASVETTKMPINFAEKDESVSEAVREAVQGRTNIDLSTLGTAFNIKDADLAPIRENQVAVTANLKGLTAITDKGLETLSHLRLQKLLINNTDTADLHALHDMSPSLTYLTANGINLNDKGFENILRLNRLQTLMIANTPISDYQLARLETLKSLKHLDIKYCPNISKASVETLKKHMTYCDVSYRSPLSDEDQKADTLFLEAHRLETTNDFDAAKSEIDRALKIEGISADMQTTLGQAKNEIVRKMRKTQ